MNREQDNRCEYVFTKPDQPDFRVRCYGKPHHHEPHWYYFMTGGDK